MQTTDRAAIHAPPGAGRAFWLVGDTYTLTVTGKQTGGAFSLSEALVRPGGGPPPHIHYAEDETFVVLEGELAFTTGAGTTSAPTGTVVHVPKGTQHAFATVGPLP